MAPTQTLIDTVLSHKAAVDEKIGALKQRLNDCGPRGNHSVESELDRCEGESKAFTLVAGWLIQDREDARLQISNGPGRPLTGPRTASR